jgi:hypothetical protein
VPEQLGIVERQDAAAVGANVDVRQLADNRSEVLLGARVIVVPRRAEAAAREAEVGFPAQPDEREAAVVLDVRAIGIMLGGRGGREEDGDSDQPRRSAQCPQLRS